MNVRGQFFKIDISTFFDEISLFKLFCFYFLQIECYKISVNKTRGCIGAKQKVQPAFRHHEMPHYKLQVICSLLWPYLCIYIYICIYKSVSPMYLVIVFRNRFSTSNDSLNVGLDFGAFNTWLILIYMFDCSIERWFSFGAQRHCGSRRAKCRSELWISAWNTRTIRSMVYERQIVGFKWKKVEKPISTI